MLKTAYVRPCTLDEARQGWMRSLARASKRRAPQLRPGKAALLVVDMQAHFLDPSSPAFLPAAPAVAGAMYPGR